MRTTVIVISVNLGGEIEPGFALGALEDGRQVIFEGNDLEMSLLNIMLSNGAEVRADVERYQLLN